MPWRNKGAIEVIGALMVLIQVLGIAATIFALRKFTGLPAWAAILLGFPIFLFVFWSFLWLISQRK